MGGGGMRGGGSDFAMVLVDCVPGGTRVKKGDPVAEFDRQAQLTRLDDYKASVIQQEANIKKLKSDQAVAKEAHNQSIRAAKAELEKARLDLKTVPVRSSIDTEKLKLAEQEAEARYKQLLEEVKFFDESQRAELRNTELDRDQAKVELQRAQNNVDRMVMKAAIDGIVVMQTMFRGGEFGQIQKGDQVSPGQPFMSIVDPSSMVMSATINQVDSEVIRVGMKARVHLDAYPDLDLGASVISVGAMTSTGMWRANYVKAIPVRLKLSQMDPRVIPDLTGSADVILTTQQHAAVAPLESVFRDAPGEQSYVFVRGPSGYEKRVVDLGMASHIVAGVRSGLRPGEVVALQRPYQEKQ
jgi:multidrug resistance efflux pump